MSFFDLPPVIERMLAVSDRISDLNFSVGQLRMEMPQILRGSLRSCRTMLAWKTAGQTVQ